MRCSELSAGEGWLSTSNCSSVRERSSALPFLWMLGEKKKKKSICQFLLSNPAFGHAEVVLDFRTHGDQEARPRIWCKPVVWAVANTLLRGCSRRLCREPFPQHHAHAYSHTPSHTPTLAHAHTDTCADTASQFPYTRTQTTRAPPFTHSVTRIPHPPPQKMAPVRIPRGRCRPLRAGNAQDAALPPRGLTSAAAQLHYSLLL